MYPVCNNAEHDIAAKLPFPVHPHMLRHSTGYKLANDGQDTRSLAHYLGSAINSEIHCACAGSICEVLEGLAFGGEPLEVWRTACTPGAVWLVPPHWNCPKII